MKIFRQSGYEKRLFQLIHTLHELERLMELYRVMGKEIPKQVGKLALKVFERIDKHYYFKEKKRC